MTCPQKIFSLSLFLLQASSIFAQGIETRQPGTDTTPRATTPEEAVKYLAEASKAGDLQAYISCLAEPFRGMRKALVDVLDAQKGLFEALDDKFGKTAGPQQHPTMNNMKKTYLEMRIEG